MHSRDRFSIVVLLACACFASAVQSAERVSLCHVPPGNPANPQTIVVGAPAVRGHMAHGDSIGPCSAEQAVVSGVVVAFDTAQPVAGAAVTLRFAAAGHTSTAIADHDGIFSFTGVPVDGSFVVEAEDGLGASGSAQGSIDAGNLESSVVVVIDQPGAGSLSGRVTRPDGQAAVGALVTYLFPETERTGSAAVDADGRYGFSGVHTDGTVIVVAFEPASMASASANTVVLPFVPDVALDLALQAPPPAQPELVNGNFLDGLDGWSTSGGPAFVVPRDEAFASQTTDAAMSLMQQSTCPVMNAAVVSSSGPGVGQLGQAFTVPPGYGVLQGRIKFLSNEWPDWFGTEFNDTFVVRMTTPSGVRVLASGNVNSSSWGPGIFGFNGQAGEINFSVDVSGWTGQTVHLHFEVRDVVDTLFPSGLAISDVRLVRTEQFVSAGGGLATGTTTIAGAFGQAVRLTFRNLNVLGTTISVRDNSAFGETRQSIILPQTSVSFTFARFGEEPMGWDFTVRTISDAFVVAYEVESTWVPGMPPNPCY